MIRRPTIVLLLMAAGCGTTWQAIDADGDGFSRQEGDCWDALEGPAGSGLDGSDIHPSATEIFYDGIDQDCDGADDYDQDGDGWVPDGQGGLATLGVPDSGQLPSGDCWDDTTQTPADFEVVPSDLEDASGRLLSWTQPTATEVNPGGVEVFYDGVDQDCADDDDFDQDVDGWRTSAYPDRDGAFGEDCIDGADLDTDNPAGSAAVDVNPDASETFYDGTDQDCDDNDCDQDGDGYPADVPGQGHCEAEDCDDEDAAIMPDEDAEEVWYNGVDEDCDDNDGDQDGDGYWAEDYDERVVDAGGTPLDVPEGQAGDCDDETDSINPGADETWYDGVDQDCDGLSDYDADLDGYDNQDSGGDDCDDEDDAINPDATETFYDGTDQDCDGLSDYDADRDGHDSQDYGGDDCDDTDAAISPSMPETFYDGTDQDCDGLSDYDADQDGWDSTDWGGEDCIDFDPGIHPDALETYYDGVDQDCDGLSDYDADLDGHDSASWLGDDCDDTRFDVSPSASETWDSADNDCNDLVDDMLVDTAALGWLDSTEVGAYLGYSSSLSVGDVDNDGVTEILVGTTADDDNLGIVWVVDAGAPGLLRGPAAGYANPTAEGEDSGNSQAVMGPIQGDVTGDAVDDLVLGGTDPDSDSDYVAVAVYQGGSGMVGTLTSDSAVLALTGASGSEPGQVISHLDMNGDGACELYYSDWSGDYWGLGANALHVVEPDGLSGEVDLDSAASGTLYTWYDDADLGRTMGGGDLDGDGYDDLLAGAPGYDDTDSDSGIVSLFLGPDAPDDWDWYGFTTYADLTIGGATADARLGEGAPPLICDLDDDGAMDLVLGEPGGDVVHLFLGAADLMGGSWTTSDADAVIQGDSDSLFGQALASADFTGDGVDDLFVGAPGSDDPSAPSSSWNGALYVLDGLLVSSQASTDTTDALATLEPDQASLLGLGVVVTDLDADGLMDPLVSAPAHDGAGRVWLLAAP